MKSVHIQKFAGSAISLLLACVLLFPPFSETYSDISRMDFSPFWSIVLLGLVLLESVGLLLKMPFVYQKQEHTSFPWWSLFLFIGHFIVTTLLLLGGLDLLGLIQMPWITIPIILLNIAKECIVFIGIPRLAPTSHWWLETIGDILLGIFISGAMLIVWRDLAYDPKMNIHLYQGDAIARYVILFFLVFYPIRIAYTLEERFVATTWQEKTILWFSTAVLFFTGFSILFQ